MLYRAYRFPDAETAAPLIEAGGYLAADDIGIAYEPAEGEAPPVALPGYHFNAVWDAAEPGAWASARIAPADAPRWWSGVPRTDPAPPPPAVPAAVSPLQARKALRAAGVLDAVDAWLATQPPGIRDAWEYAIEVRRDDQDVVVPAAAALGLTSAQIDALFLAAAAL
jgi:hypothetical protein